jgi:hypothetical protein
MADEIRRLADDIVTDLGQTQGGQSAAADARELAQGLDDFRQNQKDGASPFQMRQGYSPLHAGWQNLRSAFDRPGAGSPVIDRDLSRIDALDAQIAQALGLNLLPNDYYAPSPGPANPHIRRLARAVVDRAEALAEVIQIDMATVQDSPPLIADSALLAREADAFHDSLRVDTPPEIAAKGFAPVDVVSDRIQRYVTTRSVSPRVAAAWQAFASAEALMHQQLNLATPRPAVSIRVPGLNLVVPGVNPLPPPSTINVLAVRLDDQVGEFVRVFSQTARSVPEGTLILADAQRLQAAMSRFRDVLGRGADANELAAAFRDVDVIDQRLSRRVYRIAKGRTGPNIRLIGAIDSTCGQIHQALGLPGFAPGVPSY